MKTLLKFCYWLEYKFAREHFGLFERTINDLTLCLQKKTKTGMFKEKDSD